jgi:hypothetical protein
LAKYGQPVPPPYVGSKTAPTAPKTPAQAAAAKTSGGLVASVSFQPERLPDPHPNSQEAGVGKGPTGIPYGTSVNTWSVWDPSTWTKTQYNAVTGALLAPALLAMVPAGVGVAGAAAATAQAEWLMISGLATALATER